MRISRISIVITLLFLGIPPTLAAPASYTLRSTIEKALEHNPAIQAARFRVAAAQAAARNAYSEFLPSISLSGTAQRSYQDPMTTQFTTAGGTNTVRFGFDEPGNTFGYTATLKQAIFSGGRLSGALTAAQGNLQAAAAQAEKTGFDIFYNGSEAFLGLLKAQKTRTIADEALESANNHLKQVQSMFRQGLVPRTDVLRAEVRYYEARKQRIQAIHAVELARSSFGLVVGERVPPDFQLVDAPLIIEKIPMTLSELESLALERRPDIRNAQALKSAASGQESIARSSGLPDLSLRGTVGSQKTQYPQNNIDTDQNSWSILAAVNWQLFDGLGTAAGIQEAEARVQAALADEQTVRDLALYEVKQAYYNYLTQEEELEVAQKSLELEQETYRLADVRYKSGLGTNADLIDAQVALTQARTDGAASQLDYILAKAGINKATGANVFDLLKVYIEQEEPR